MPAGHVLEQQRRLSSREPAIAPTQHGYERPVEIAPHVGQQIFVAIWGALVEAANEYAVRHQPRQPVCEDIGRNRKLGLDLVVAAIAEERLAHDHEAPFVADDLQRAGHRAWSPQRKSIAVGGAPCVAASPGRVPARSGPVTEFHIPGVDVFAAMRAGDEGMTLAATVHVNQRQWRHLAIGKPAIAKLHQRDEARIKIEAHPGQAIFLALRARNGDLPEDRKLRQLAQTIGQRCARNSERRPERLESLGAEEGFADNQEGPGVGNDVQCPRDRTVSFPPWCGRLFFRRDRLRRRLGFRHSCGRGAGHCRRYLFAVMDSMAAFDAAPSHRLNTSLRLTPRKSKSSYACHKSLVMHVTKRR